MGVLQGFFKEMKGFHGFWGFEDARGFVSGQGSRRALSWAALLIGCAF